METWRAGGMDAGWSNGRGAKQTGWPCLVPATLMVEEAMEAFTMSCSTCHNSISSRKTVWWAMKFVRANISTTTITTILVVVALLIIYHTCRHPTIGT